MLRQQVCWFFDALREWTEFDLDVIMVGPWMLCGNGWSLIWTWLAHGCSVREWMESDEMDVIMVGPMDALRAWMGPDLNVIMVGTWMRCGHGWGLI